MTEQVLFRGKPEYELLQYMPRVFKAEVIATGFVMGNLTYYQGVPYITSDITDIDRGIGAWDWGYPIIPETLGQYTGIHDKNGDRIFAGDIIHAKSWGTRGYWIKDWNTLDRVVTFSDGAFKLFPVGYSYSAGGFELSKANSGRFEIVGNIHIQGETIARN